MTPKKYIVAPVPIMTVLDHALAAMATDKRFRSVPNGRIEIGWHQRARGRDGEGNRPERYRMTLEFAFTPEATKE